MEELPLREALLEGFGVKFEGGLDDCLDEAAVDTFLWFFALVCSLLWMDRVGREELCIV